MPRRPGTCKKAAGGPGFNPGIPCSTGRDCDSGRCATESHCGFFKTELESKLIYPSQCEGCNLGNLVTNCKVQDITFEYGVGGSATKKVGSTNQATFGLDVGVGINLIGLGRSSKQVPFGNRVDFGVGISASFSQPGAEPGQYWNNKDAFPCPAGYYCPTGTKGKSSDFGKFGKYHGGSAKWLASTGREDLRCNANYYCPKGSTAATGRPAEDYKSKLRKTLCAKNEDCPCGKGLVAGKWCGLAAKAPESAEDCPLGFYCVGGKRKDCPAGYVPPSCRADIVGPGPPRASAPRQRHTQRARLVSMRSFVTMRGTHDAGTSVVKKACLILPSRKITASNANRATTARRGAPQRRACRRGTRTQQKNSRRILTQPTRRQNCLCSPYVKQVTAAPKASLHPRCSRTAGPRILHACASPDTTAREEVRHARASR